jgi:predicted NBD/HSP70 family sugar kinase
MKSILELILEDKSITRVKLASSLKISASSIVKYMKVLFDIGMVSESERELPSGGRRSVVLEFNPEIGLNVAIVLDASRVTGTLMNMVGGIVEKAETPVTYGVQREDLLQAIFGITDTLIAKAASLRKKLYGIGIGLGGFVDDRRGVSRKYLYAADWYEVPLKQIMEDKFGLPCSLLKDVNAFALGEKYYGSGQGVGNFVGVWLGEGIGTGIVVNGEICIGAKGHAGELGHTRSSSSSTLCYCGHRGCLETIASVPYVLEKCREGLRSGVRSEMTDLCDGLSDDLTIDHVKDAARAGDRLARNIMSDVAENIGRTLSDLVTVLNPELVILRGPLVDNNQFLYENIERIVLDGTLQETAASLRMAFSTKAEDIRLCGINSYIIKGFFS